VRPPYDHHAAAESSRRVAIVYHFFEHYREAVLTAFNRDTQHIYSLWGINTTMPTLAITDSPVTTLTKM
jgi:hypothetical protein